MTDSGQATTERKTGLLGKAVRTGTVAAIAMIPFAAVFRARGLRINEYGRKTLDLVVGDVPPRVHDALTFVQHIAIGCAFAVPYFVVAGGLRDRRGGVLLGLACGGAMYALLNAWALPLAFGDPTPWRLGFDVVYPSLVVHLVYGAVLGWLATRE